MADTLYGIQISTKKSIPDFESSNTKENLLANAISQGIAKDDVEFIECTTEELDAVVKQYFIDNPPEVDQEAIADDIVADAVVAKIATALVVPVDDFDTMMASRYGIKPIN